MIDQNRKVRENRLRRKAERQGLLLHKSRRRDPDATDYGAYALHGRSIGALEINLTLDEIEARLTKRGAQ